MQLSCLLWAKWAGSQECSHHRKGVEAVKEPGCTFYIRQIHDGRSLHLVRRFYCYEVAPGTVPGGVLADLLIYAQDYSNSNNIACWRAPLIFPGCLALK